MLTDEQKEFFGETLVPVFQELEQYIYQDIARRMNKEKRFTETAEIMAENLRKLGYSPYKIRMEVFKALKADKDYIEMIERNTREEKAAVQEAIDQAKEQIKALAPELYDAVGNMSFNNDLSVWAKAGEALTKSSNVEKYIAAMQKRGTGELLNLTKTTAFMSKSGTVVPARKAFTHAMNNAITQITSGAVSSGQATRDAIKELTASGLRYVEYASGRTWQIDTACRNAVRTAVGQLAGEIMQANIDETGVEMVQVDSHWGARESHALWQGQVYTLEQFKAICGYGEPSNPDHIYSYNCRHNHYPYWPGISEPIEYQKEPDPVEVNGKTYTYYQATQKQRQMERQIRQLKRDNLYADADNKTLIKQKTAEYKAFSEKVNIRAKLERCQVVGYDKGSPVPGGGKIAKDAFSAEKLKSTIEAIKYSKMKEIGSIDRTKFAEISEHIRSETVVLTTNQKEHIIQRRGLTFYENYSPYFDEILKDPDYIFADEKNVNTAIVCKTMKSDGTNINLVVKLALEGDDPEKENSLITAISEGDKRYKQRLRNKTPIYKKQ